jgi:hypothetical protein
MGVVVVGIAIADAITSEKIENLKRKINMIVDKHKDITEKVKTIS